MIVKTIRLSVGPKSTQEGVRLLLDFFASNSEISTDLLHENIRGILLAETSGLTSSEFASV